MIKQLFLAKSLADTARAAVALAATLNVGDCVAIEGGMGAGKTAFCAAVAEALGAQNQACSPTFALMNRYQGKLPIYHFDLYRLTCEQEVCEAGLDEFFEADGVALIEWPQVAQALLSEKTLRLTIDVEAETRRPASTDAAENETRRLTLTGLAVLLDGWTEVAT